VPTDLRLIRHGESVANTQPIIAGMLADVGLTDRGRRQAALLEDRLRTDDWAADVLYASTLPRAVQTAAYVSRGLGLPVAPDDEVQELRPGVADGLSIAEWRRRYPGLDPGPTSRPYQRFSPGGESWAEFVVRAGAALLRIVERHPEESVVVVTHGGVIEASFHLALSLGASAPQAGFAPANTSITHWRHDPDGPTGLPWSLITFNDARHLVGETDGAPPLDAVPTAGDDTASDPDA
jgi:probable phosphoglycerate mutase